LKEQTRCEHDLYIARKIINARGQQLAEIGAKIRRISIKK
jgi:hypothetical protein